MIEPYYSEGGITIYHGDCREILPSIEADVLVTDPPYGIDWDTDLTRFGSPSNRTWERIAGDREPFDPRWLLSYGRCVIFGAPYFSSSLPEGGWLVWNKRDQAGGKNLLSDAEMAWHNCGGQRVAVFNLYWNGCYRTGEMRTAHHPNQKPVSLMRWVIERFTSPGDLVVDPYAGGGSVLVAARDLGRKAIGIEIEERYCEIAAKRLGQEVMDFGGLAA